MAGGYAVKSDWRACEGSAVGGVAGLVGDAQSQFGREGFKRQTNCRIHRQGTGAAFRQDHPANQLSTGTALPRCGILNPCASVVENGVAVFLLLCSLCPVDSR